MEHFSLFKGGCGGHGRRMLIMCTCLKEELSWLRLQINGFWLLFKKSYSNKELKIKP